MSVSERLTYPASHGPKTEVSSKRQGAGECSASSSLTFKPSLGISVALPCSLSVTLKGNIYTVIRDLQHGCSWPRSTHLDSISVGC